MRHRCAAICGVALRVRIASLASFVAVVAGCTHDDIGVGCEALAGDLVISEIMANPVDLCSCVAHDAVGGCGESACGDKGREWFEVYNASPVLQVLDRIVIQRLSGTADDPTIAADHSIRYAPRDFGPGQYAVLGDGLVGVGPLDYSYGVSGESLSALANTSGGLRLLCKGAVVDEVWYGGGPEAFELAEGRSVSLDGGVPPDALQNDDAGLWCASVRRYDGVNAGSPGEKNPMCGLVACNQYGRPRQVEPPQVGDLVITEVLADPNGAGGRDWVELYVAASRAVDLNGLRLVVESESGRERRARVTSLECLTAQPGEYFTIAGPVDRSDGGSLVPDAVAPGLDLFATAGLLSLRRGAVVLDSVPLLPPKEGRSVALDASVPLTPGANDDAAVWCFGSAKYDGSNAGSPGEPNPGCSVVECLDGGDARPTVRPGPGDLLVTELLSRPKGPDTGQEWLEVLVTAASAVDLNGLIVSKSGNAMAMSPTCVSAHPGEYRIIGASLLPSLTVDIVAPGMLISQGAGNLELRRGSAVVDAVRLPHAPDARALALDAAATTDSGNDEAGNWCFAEQPYDGANAGTPRVANPSCGIAGCGVHATRPGEGDLLITEVFSNPSGNEDGKEWIEVLVTAGGPVDLHGVILKKSTSVFMAIGSSCVTAMPGEYQVIGASSHPGANGSVTVDIQAPYLAFSATGGDIELYRGDTLIDAALVPRALDGASLSLDPRRIAAADNDEPSDFCWGREATVFDEAGSPGLPNGGCETGCDDGDTVREPVLPEAGDLIITEVYANPTGTDEGRDWLELYVAAPAPVELNGLVVENQGSGSPKRWALESLACVTVFPGTYAVVGGENAVVDGVTIDAQLGELGDSLLLGTVSARLAVVAMTPAGQITLDAIEYAKPTAGVTSTLDTRFLDAGANDDGANWCLAPLEHPPFAGTGSPGVMNDACP